MNAKPCGTLVVTLVLLAGLALSACRMAEPSPDPATAAPGFSGTVLPPEPQVTAPAGDAAARATPAEGEAAPLPVATGGPSVEPASPPVRPASLGPITGIEMHSIDAAGGLELVKASGVHWLRRNALLWSRVEPQEGARNWAAVSALETEMQNAAAAGMELILIVRSTPEWAQALPGIACGPVRPDKLEAFAAFLADAVSRYSAPPYNVRYWEIWNEPDIDPTLVVPDSIFGCWGDNADPNYGGGYYAEMLKAAYPRIKAANAEAQVLVGGLVVDCDPANPPETAPGSGQMRDCRPATYLEGILQNGGGDFFDGVSFHAYDGYLGQEGVYGNDGWNNWWDQGGPLQIVKARYLRSLLVAYGYPQKYLMNTESALICGRDGTEPDCQSETFNRTKAYYAAQVFASGLAEGLSADIWYSTQGWRGSGLFTPQGETHPVYQAVAFSATELNGAVFAGEIRQFPGVKGYEWLQNGKRIWLVWSQDGPEHPVDLPSLPAAAYDVFGQPQAVSQQLVVTIAPVYLEW